MLDKNNTSPFTQAWLPFMLAVAMGGGIWLGFQIHARTQPYPNLPADFQSSLPNAGGGKVQEVMRFIDARYLEGIEQKELQEAAIQGVLSRLDPHSNYISSDDLEGINESLAGGFEGVGIEFAIVDDTVYVVGVLPDGPSDKAGVQVGDKILRVNDSLVAGVGIDNKGIIQHLKGHAGSSAKVDLLRPMKGPLSLELERAQIPMKSIDVSYMLKDGIGYIKINRFSGKTYKEFMDALELLVEKGKMKHLVLDLRQNSGGYLDQATEILSQLFDKKALLVYTEGRSYKRKEYNSTGKHFFPIERIAVLIDEGSASAAEIVAGAIQDNDRGLIIGRRSFGKGLVQEQYDLSDRSALRLTVARYYTPSGRLIQKPYEQGRDVYEQDMSERSLSGELFNRDSIKISDSTKYYTTGGRVVYGGGGIVPDIFVPLDSLYQNRYFLRWSNALPLFSYRYFDSQFAYLKGFKNLEQFLKEYEVRESALQAFKAFCETQKLPYDEGSWRRSKGQMSLLLKAYLAKQLFREEGFYRVYGQQDPVLKEALKELEKQHNPTANK